MDAVMNGSPDEVRQESYKQRVASIGTLVRTLASHRAYYDRWAKTWEFQALLKARPVACHLLPIIKTAGSHHAGRWHTASMLCPSGSRTNAP